MKVLPTAVPEDGVMHRVPQVGVLADLWLRASHGTGLGVPRPVAPGAWKVPGVPGDHHPRRLELSVDYVWFSVVCVWRRCFGGRNFGGIGGSPLQNDTSVRCR